MRQVAFHQNQGITKLIKTRCRVGHGRYGFEGSDRDAGPDRQHRRTVMQDRVTNVDSTSAARGFAPFHVDGGRSPAPRNHYDLIIIA